MRHMQRTLGRGFSMIELMVALSVASILLSLAVPSFVRLIQNNRAAIAANEMLFSAQLARGEAVKHARAVRLCPSSDAAACSGGTAWEGGWIVWIDRNRNDALDADEVLRVVNPLGGAVTLSGPAGLGFSEVGTAISSAVFEVRAGRAGLRQVCVQMSGRSEVVREGEASDACDV